MARIEIVCEHCGAKILRYQSQIKPHNYCSRACLGAAVTAKELVKDTAKTSAHMSEYNRRCNPLNRPSKVKPDASAIKGTTEERELQRRYKLRAYRLGKGSGKSYEKLFGRHLHRIVAEQKLGRPLAPGEVVHHIDGNKRNNNPDNLMVFPSQKEHAKWHATHEGGDAQ